MSEKHNHTELLFDLLARWQDGHVSNAVLRRDLSGLASNTDFLEGKVAALEAKLEAMEQERRETWGMCALISLFEEIERYFGRFPVGTEEQGHDATVGSLLHQLRRLRLVATRTIAAQQEKEDE